MRRPQLMALIAAGVVVFLVISFLLARVFGSNNAEQNAITDLVRFEAQGNQREMIASIEGCATSAACRQRVAQDATGLQHSGVVTIIQLNPSTSFTLGPRTGTARVAWTAGGSLPIVQCVRVHRAGNVLKGMTVDLLEISKRINSGADCPAQY